MNLQASLRPNATNLCRWMAITWILTKILSFRLWLADRTFPLIASHRFFDDWPAWTHIALLGISLITLLLFCIKPNAKLAMVILCAEILSCLADQNRWQPWEYFFIFMSGGLACIKTENTLLAAWRWLLAGLYFFSGLYKISPGFIHDVWQNLILFRWLGVQEFHSWLLRAGYVTGITEMLAGIGLLFSSTRKISGYILIVMHLLILLVIGPSGLNLNNVVWPWNLLMAGLIYMLFIKQADVKMINPFRHLYLTVIMLAWWLLPWLHIFGYWDTYLSSALYSGGVPQLYVCPDNDELKKDLAPYTINKSAGLSCSPVISYYQWSMKELNVVPYEETRIYRAVVKKINMKYPGANRYFVVKHGFSTRVWEINER